MTTRVIEYAGMTAAAIGSALDRVLEEVAIRGFSVVENVLSAEECRAWAARLDELNRRQVEKFGERRLEELGEGGTVRGMLADDPEFLALVRHPATWPIVERAVGPAAILHLQNGIIVEPEREHHQAAFHRDFAKDFVSDKMLSINVLFAIDDFTAETGGTRWVPHTHRSATMPSAQYLDANAVQIDVAAGSVVVFDSLLVHCAGRNVSPAPRRAINHQYTRPFIKQQLDYPALLRGRVDPESPLAQTLGFWSVPPRSVDEFRVDPARRTYRQGQG
jgi:ectoine hydroxylase-related dioxygenase (phytanoyl-CoA dioxygenase family)